MTTFDMSVISVGLYGSALSIIQQNGETASLVVTGIVMGVACSIDKHSHDDTSTSYQKVAETSKAILYAIALMMIVYHTLLLLDSLYIDQHGDMPNMVYGAIAALSANNAVSIVYWLAASIRSIVSTLLESLSMLVGKLIAKYTGGTK